jgi:hypothetical protein
MVPPIGRQRRRFPGIGRMIHGGNRGGRDLSHLDAVALLLPPSTEPNRAEGILEAKNL